MHTQKPRQLPPETQKFALFLLGFLESYLHDGRNAPNEMDDESKWFYFERETGDLKDALTGFLTFFIHHPDGSSILPGMIRLPETIETCPPESNLPDVEPSVSSESRPSKADIAPSIVLNDRTPITAEAAAENISMHLARIPSNPDVKIMAAQVTEPQSVYQQILTKETIEPAMATKRTSDSIHNGKVPERVTKKKPIVLPSLCRLPMSETSTNITHPLDRTTVGKQRSQQTLPPKHGRTSTTTGPRKPVFILPKPKHDSRPGDYTFRGFMRQVDYNRW